MNNNVVNDKLLWRNNAKRKSDRHYAKRPLSNRQTSFSFLYINNRALGSSLLSRCNEEIIRESSVLSVGVKNKNLILKNVRYSKCFSTKNEWKIQYQ